MNHTPHPPLQQQPTTNKPTHKRTIKNPPKRKTITLLYNITQAHAEKENTTLDITSISSYSKQNHYVRYGYNRDGESLPQINLCLLQGQTSKLPLYYESLNGSLKDVSALENVLKTLSWLNITNIHPVMDKGFYSEYNVDKLFEHGFLFTVGCLLRRCGREN
jgi:transposase